MSASKQRVMVVFVDALGPGQLERFGPQLGSLPHRRALTGILGYSSGALPTLLTGTEPATHGRMCLFSAKAEGERGILAPLAWLGLLPRIVHERGRLRHTLSKVLAATAGLTGYVALHRVPPDAFEWLDLPEREDLFAAQRIGGVPTFLAEAREAGLSVYTAQWRLPEAERWRAAHAALEADTPDLAFLYATELDAVLHENGSAGTKTTAVIERIAANIDRARNTMARGGVDLVTLVVGDHGMADVDAVFDPRPVLAKAGSARAFVDSTMLRFWGTDGELAQARAAVERAKVPGTWLDEQALIDRAAPTRGAPYGRAMLLLREGTIFAPSYVGGRVRGMHGYDVDSRSARAALASDAPLPDGCVALSDVASHVRAGLGLAS